MTTTIDHSPIHQQLDEISTQGREDISVIINMPTIRLNNFSLRRTSSLPIQQSDTKKGGVQLQGVFQRSQSVPAINTDRSIRHMNYLPLGDVCPQIANGHVRTTNALEEEEAVCRICLVELAQGGDTLKMECSCKGELALAHHECAVKWFRVKGNRICDVCKQDVQNLPGIRNFDDSGAQGPAHAAQDRNSFEKNRPSEFVALIFSVWQGVPFLLSVNILGFFCFLELLLVPKKKGNAVATSLPFSFFLGLVTSLTASTMVERKYVWVYSTIQFGMVALFAYLSYLSLQEKPALSIIVAACVGVGLTVLGKLIIVEFLKWSEQADGEIQSFGLETVTGGDSGTIHHATTP